eukprot:gene427-540_t
MSSTQIYSVPVVCNGLRETESILQIVDSLEKLEKVFNEMYATINTRVAQEKTRIDSVANRLNNAQYKVNQIVGSKSAITVFSSAKYPSEKKWDDYVPLYANKHKQPFKPSHYHLHDLQVKKRPDDSYLELNDLVFIEKSIDAASKEIEVKEGLGHIPNHLPSVSNLLLFNTQENPYKKYSNTLDNLAGGSGEELVIFGEKKKTLQAAPHTVEKGDILPGADKVSIKYDPGAFEVPTYNFPSNLDLPNVAQNLTYMSDIQSIAPSQQVPANLLPTFDQNAGAAAQPAPSGAPPSSQPPLQQPYQQQPTSAPPSAPPPPPPPFSNNVPPPPPPPVHNSAPPPPPPMPQGPTELKDDSDNEQQDEPSNGSAIGNLLADIRRGHKSRLKKTKTKGEGEDGEGEDIDDAPKPPPKPKGGDVMSDLVLALMRRRESIAANSNKQNSKSSKKQDTDKEDSESDWDD